MATKKKTPKTAAGDEIMKGRGRYTVRYELDETGWWFARVLEIQGCHTQGRSVETARRRIREALSLFVEDAKTAELIDDVAVDASTRAAVAKWKERQRRLVAEQEAAARVTRELARTLVLERHLSVRDAGEVLGLSHTRIAQLVEVKARGAVG